MKISKMQQYRKSLRTAFNGFIKSGLSVENAYKTVKETEKNAYKGSEEAFETQFAIAFKNVERVKTMKVEAKNIAKEMLVSQIALQYDIILNGDIDCIDEIMSENTFAIYHKKTGLRCNYERTKVESNELPCMKFKDVNGAKRISYIHCFDRFFELRTV